MFLPLAVPLLSWTLVSGMETAFASAVLGRAVAAVDQTIHAGPHVRATKQRRAGLWIALLALARPELVPLGLALIVALGHASGSTSLWRSLLRATGPLAIALSAYALLNVLETGELAANGAIRKLITNDPYASPSDVALLVLVNTLRMYTVGFDVAFGGRGAVYCLLALAAASLFGKHTSRLGAALVCGAIASFFLVTANKTAPYQNLRYVAPTLLMLLVAAGLGLRAIASRSPRAGTLAAALAIFMVVSASRELGVQRRHYAASARNIYEQQVEVGRRIGAMDPPVHRVFVGDAGAIPYLADVSALDGLGLGGYHDMPFARASTHGVASVIELVERLPSAERPDALAIYDAWWPGIGEHFGQREFSVRIEDNVICADPEKVVYRAHWDLLEDRAALEAGTLCRIDFADIVDERKFEVRLPHPRGGHVTSNVLADADGQLRWDAERILAEGQSLSFAPPPTQRALVITLVTDSPAGARVRIGDVDAVVQPHDEQSWGVVVTEVPAQDRLTIEAVDALRIASLTVR